MHLRLAVDNTTATGSSTPATVSAYADLLQARRTALERDLEYYDRRLREAEPRTATVVSLRPVYEAHAIRIRELLRSF